MDDYKDQVLDLMLRLGQNHFPTPNQFKEYEKYNLLDEIVTKYGDLHTFCKLHNLCNKAEYEKRVLRGRTKRNAEVYFTEAEQQIIDEVKKYMEINGYDDVPKMSTFKTDGQMKLYRTIFKTFTSIEYLRGVIRR